MSGVHRFGNYFLLKKIAAGGMAELHKAKKSGEKGFEKLLAIKLILSHLASNDEFISMFIDEAKVAALLNHQNIVQIYDLGRIEDSYCIVMEYVRGKDLRTVISRAIKARSPMSIEHACLITANILSGLSYAHRKRDKGADLNIVHRDISPQNILISYEGEVKIVDFGIAKAATQSRDTKTGVLKGKLSYMSPEQALGRPLDMRSDVFSTGIVFYEMLTGRRLFQGDTDIATLEKVRAAKVEPLPTSLSRNFPAELELIVLKALAKEPSERYQSAGDMETDLLEFMRGAGYSLSGYSLSGYMRGLFREDIEQEIREEQELDNTVVPESRINDTVKSPAGGSVTTPAREPSGNRPAVKPAGDRQPKPAISERKTSGGGRMVVAVVAVLALALGAVWFGARIAGRDVLEQPVVQAPLDEPAETAVDTAMVMQAYSGLTTDTDEFVPEEAAALDEASTEEAPSETAAVEAAAEPGPEPAPVEKPKPKPEPAQEEKPKPGPEPAPEEKPKLVLAPASAVISSEPPGAEVYVDGELAGNTPLSMEGLEPERAHSVKIGLDGYRDWSGSFSARPGGTGTVHAVMEVVTFDVDVSSTPAGAKVLLEGKDTGTVTPATIDSLVPGRSYTVRLELDGFSPYEQTVNSDGPGTQKLNAELVRQYGELTINTKPWAFVFIDGEKKGMTPLAGIRLAAGEHEVALSNPKLELRRRLKVRIKPDETTKVMIDLTDKNNRANR